MFFTLQDPTFMIILLQPTRATDRFVFLRANENPFYQFVLVLYNYCQRRKGFVYVYNKKPTFITVNYTCDVFVSMKLQKHFWRFLKKHIRNSRSVKNLTAGGRHSVKRSLLAHFQLGNLIKNTNIY